MSRIEIVSASAGSGKTYRLAEILRKSLESEQARPEAIVAVTFTTKAAAELQERARRFLIEKGRYEDAQRLRASRMGTVNSVCGRLLREFAFDLGLSPDQQVLDDPAAEAALRRARSLFELSGGEGQLAELGSRMRFFEAEGFIREILDRARVNGITPAELEACRDRSLETFLELLPPPLSSARSFEKKVIAAFETFLEATKEGDGTKTTQKARADASSALSRLASGRALDWNTWAKLAEFSAAKSSQEAASEVASAAQGFQCHPRLREDLEKAIRLVFDAAAGALDAYQRYKKERGVVDFPDQLAVALDALRTPAIRHHLEGEIDLVLVDEFQDTNPLQLAIFLELAGLAKRSVWVGDQKQSIFGFIDTDPVLMDSAIEAILGDKEPETLPLSWRSRPELVRLTSEVFAPAFERVGIPGSRTRLEPELKEEPAGLGAIVERWRLVAGRTAKSATDALAAGVQELLADPEVRVRDPETKETRAVRFGDLAILCRTHKSALRVAGSLAALGIPSVLPRTGLLQTPEGQLVFAGLQRWVDPRDTSAAATLGRLTGFPGDGVSWLEAALESPRAGAFVELPAVESLDAARRAHPEARLLEAYDQTVEAIAARDLACSWGQAEERLANLDALRSLVVAYERLRSVEGRPATLGGLIPWLLELSAAGEDPRAVQANLDAVEISTWHGAKGLEWPITLLFELEFSRDDSALGVHVEQGSEGFQFENPLAERWIRFWPNPFHVQRKKSFLHEALDTHPTNIEVLDQQNRERLRLFYVGWTRARDRVVLASKAKKQLEELTCLVRGDEGPLLIEPTENAVAWAGREVQVCLRQLEAVELEISEPEGGKSYVEAGPRDHPLASVSPSVLTAEGRLGPVEEIGKAIALRGAPDMRAVGEAVHTFLAADLRDHDTEQRHDLAESVLERWGVSDVMSIESLVRSSDDLRRWIESQWPDARWHREWPSHNRLEVGTTIHGSADLVLELDDGFVLIDHKSFRTSSGWSEERIAALSGQLGAYSKAIAKSTGLELMSCWVHLPLEGCVVRLET